MRFLTTSQLELHSQFTLKYTQEKYKHNVEHTFSRAKYLWKTAQYLWKTDKRNPCIRYIKGNFAYSSSDSAARNKTQKRKTRLYLELLEVHAVLDGAPLRGEVHHGLLVELLPGVSVRARWLVEHKVEDTEVGAHQRYAAANVVGEREW